MSHACFENCCNVHVDAVVTVSVTVHLNGVQGLQDLHAKYVEALDFFRCWSAHIYRARKNPGPYEGATYVYVIHHVTHPDLRRSGSMTGSRPRKARNTCDG